MFCQKFTPSKGSPPRMRGKVPDERRQHRKAGITPAHAGKRFAQMSRDPGLGDHPRACGEKTAPLNILPGSKGSPPRMRGKGQAVPQVVTLAGITPAHAGKRFLQAAHAPGVRDHPRACGEKAMIDWKLALPEGSPPRMRGKGVLGGLHLVGHGITPAHAGKSGHVFCGNVVLGDHPRACGEKTKKIP